MNTVFVPTSGFNGFGGGYNNCCTPATAQGVTDAFNFNQLDGGIRSIANGLCDGFYAMNNAVNGVNSTVQNCCCQTQQNLMQGFNGVQTSIMQNSYQNQAGFNSVANQLSSCCCDIERGQDAIRYEMARNTCDIITENDKNTDRIINYLTNSELQNLRSANEEYRSQLQLATLRSNLVNDLLPVAKPAYLTCSPYASAFGYNGYNPYNTNNGYGCGCA